MIILSPAKVIPPPVTSTDFSAAVKEIRVQLPCKALASRRWMSAEVALGAGVSGSDVPRRESHPAIAIPTPMATKKRRAFMRVYRLYRVERSRSGRAGRARATWNRGGIPPLPEARSLAREFE